LTQILGQTCEFQVPGGARAAPLPAGLGGPGDAAALRIQASPGRESHSDTTLYISFVIIYKIYRVASE
jgi:hypothetical protein